MTAYVVEMGEVSPYDPEHLPPRDRYGMDWLYVEAPDAEAALARAERWDASNGSAPVEVALFVALYVAGHALLPGDAWVTIDDIAGRAGVTRSTVKQWRVRHPSFPAPMRDEGRPLWAWSEVAEWLRRPRRPGRPAAIDHRPSSR